LAGWREWGALPDLGIPRIKVKLDTGARSSALHVVQLEIAEGAAGRIARFRVPPHQGDDDTLVEAEAPVVDRRRVRSSTGAAQLRPVILTTLRLGDESWPIEVTLTRRPLLRFRMLLGRQALRGRIRVDPGRSYLLGR
jgi:hypothetical protein